MMRRINHAATIISLIICLLLTVVLFSCNGGSDSEGAACKISPDCPNTQTCVWETCQQSCSTISDCPQNTYCHNRGVCTSCASHMHCDADEICAFGECVTAQADELYGTACVVNENCLNGEICRDGRCTPLCSENKDCRAPRSICQPDEHYCVECLADVNCPDNRSCTDGVCEKPAIDGDEELPIDGDEELQPDGDIEEIPTADINEPCAFSEDPTLPECREGLECLYNSKLSFCSNPCSNDSDCTAYFENGCCLPLSQLGEQSFCLTEQFCAILGN